VVGGAQKTKGKTIRQEKATVWVFCKRKYELRKSLQSLNTLPSFTEMHLIKKREDSVLLNFEV